MEATIFGVDWGAPPALDDGEQRVVVPDTPCALLPHEFSLLKSLINPLRTCDDFGIAMYCATRAFVSDVLSERNS